MENKVIVIREGDTLYGIDASIIQEIMTAPAIYALPGLPDYLMGISPCKGKLLPVFSLQKLCGLPDLPGLPDLSGSHSSRDTAFLIFSTEKGNMGILVESVEDIISCPEDTVSYDAMNLNKGILKIAKILRLDPPVFVLDIPAITNSLKEIC